MVNCAIAFCRNTSGKMTKDRDGVTFHRFPREKKRRRQWEIAINREETWSATSASAVCSEHFDLKHFYLTESGLRRLSSNAIPTVNLAVCQSPEPTHCDKHPLEILPTDSEEVVQLKHKVNRLEIIAANRKRRLNLMWQGKRRLRKKFDTMQSLVEDLIKIKKENKH